MALAKTLAPRALSLALVIVALAGMLALTPSPAAAAQAVNDVEALQVAYIGSGDETVLMVIGRLPSTTPLPAVVEMSLPAGLAPFWAGEMQDADGSGSEIKVNPTKVRTENGFDVYQWTVTTSRTFQIEATVGSIFAPGPNGSMTTTVKHISPNRATSAVIGVDVPPGFIPADTTNVMNLGPSQSGTVWGTPLENVEAGTEMTLSLTYIPGSMDEGAKPVANTANTVGLVVAILISAAFGVGAFFVVRRAVAAR